MLQKLMRVIAQLALVLALSGGALALAQNEPPARPVAELLNEWKGALDQIGRRLASGQLEVPDLDKLRADAERVRAAVQATRPDAQAKVTAAQQLLEAMGPAPADGQPAEAKDVAKQRQQLQADLAAAEGRAKQLEVTEARANAAVTDIAKAIRDRVAQSLLAQGPSLFEADVWKLGSQQIVAGLQAVAVQPLERWRGGDVGAQARASSGVLVLMFLALVAGGWTRGWLLRRYGRDPLVTDASYARRSVATIAEGCGRALLPSLAIVAVAATCRIVGLVDDATMPALYGVAAGAIFYLLVTGLDRAALAPDLPAWRLLRISDRAARRLSWRVNLNAAVIAPLLFLSVAAPVLDLGDESRAMLVFIGSLALGLALLTVIQRRAWEVAAPAEAGEASAAAATPSGEETTGRGLLAPLWVLLRALVGIGAVASPLIALFGYPNLARYLIENLVLTGIGVGLLLVLRRVFAELIDRALILRGRPGPLARAFALTEQSAQMVDFWLMLLVDMALCGVGAILALLQWGVRWADIANGLYSLLFGFKVGGVTLSLIDLLTAIALFSAVLAASRMAQRVLEERVLPHTRLDVGLRNSFKSAVGYVGLVIALVVAVTTLGIDLSKIALLAGALSVGIGFGLQNIVSNFVSGVILLAERPIKVGDSVVVAGSEGVVRRINVRATELETAQRATVIIPNSTLLSQAVLNWTHKDTFGRVEVQVGVAYEADPEQVRRILLECATNHPEVSRWPQPSVLFKAFGPSSMDFELRAYLANVDLKGVVGSDLRFAIVRAFREAGIEIPFNQSEVRLRDLDRLGELLATVRGAEAEPPAPPPTIVMPREARG